MLLLEKPILLQIPDLNKEFTLDTDASGIAIAGIIKQVNNEGQLQAVAYASISLQGTEKQLTNNRRIVRWALQLQEYNMTILYRSGEGQTHVNMLTRTPYAENKENDELVDRSDVMYPLVSCHAYDLVDKD